MQFLQPFVRAFRWHRRTFAALLLAVAVLAGLSAVVSSDPDGVPVVVAVRGLTGGSVVAAADLQVVRVPPGVVPEGAFAELTGPAGRTVVVDVPARAVLTGSVLLDSAARAGPGRVALPVRFGEAAAVALLGVGSRIDVLGPDSTGAGYGVVATDVRVLALPRPPEDGLLAAAGSPLVLLEVTAAQAAAVTAAASVSALGFALR